MIEISIKNTDITPLWFLLGTEILLDFNNPGPKKIDETKLSIQQKTELANAIRSKIIFVHNAQSPIKTTQTVQQLIEEQRFERISKMREFLTQEIKVLKVQIKNRSITDLRLLLDEEKNGKARKTILDLIEKSISKHQREVFNKVGTDTQEKEIQKFKSLKSLLDGNTSSIEFLTEIEESEEDKVEIKI